MRRRILFAGVSALCAGAFASFTGCETTEVSGGGGVTTARGSLTEQGRKLYYGRCTACHAPEPVRDYALAEWQTLIPEMAEESNLNPAQESALRAYVNSFF